MQNEANKTSSVDIVAAGLTGGGTADLTNAKTILTLLGGPEFITRTGATSLLGATDELQVNIPLCGRARKTINAVVIHLAADGTYHVWFGRHYRRSLRLRTASEHDGVGANQLQALFSRETGLTISARPA